METRRTPSRLELTHRGTPGSASTLTGASDLVDHRRICSDRRRPGAYTHVGARLAVGTSRAIVSSRSSTPWMWFSARAVSTIAALVRSRRGRGDALGGDADVVDRVGAGS